MKPRPERLLISLLLHDHAHDPVLLLVGQLNILVLGIERVEDSGVVVLFVLLERYPFLIVLRHNIVAVPGGLSPECSSSTWPLEGLRVFVFSVTPSPFFSSVTRPAEYGTPCALA